MQSCLCTRVFSTENNLFETKQVCKTTVLIPHFLPNLEPLCTLHYFCVVLTQIRLKSRICLVSPIIFFAPTPFPFHSAIITYSSFHKRDIKGHTGEHTSSHVWLAIGFWQRESVLSVCQAPGQSSTLCRPTANQRPRIKNIVL